MNPLALLIIYFTIFLGPMVTMISSNLLIMWVGLEMSLLSITPILMNKSNPRSTEAATKYFLTQALASMILLLSITLNFKQLGSWNFQPQSHNFIINLMFISLMMKMGLAPFHLWLPEVTQGISTQSGLILLTWQKVAPLSILYQTHELINTKLILVSAILSIMIGGWNGLNQTQTRKIMAYSSIAHMGWMTAILPFNPPLMLFNLFIYIMLTTAMFTLMITYNLTSINSTSLLWNKIPATLPITSLILLSLGGLPPLTGFLPKWLIITELLKNNNTLLTTLMAMMALLNLFFYTRLIYSSSLTTFPSYNNIKILNHHKMPKNYPIMPTLIILSSMALPLMPQMNL